MSDDTPSQRQKILQVIHQQLSLTEPKFDLLDIETQLLVKQIKAMDTAVILEDSYLTEDDLKAFLNSMLDSSIGLKEFMKDFGEFLDLSVSNSPQSEAEWSFMFKYGLGICHDVRIIYGSISGTAYILLELWSPKRDTEQELDAVCTRLYKILELTQTVDAFVNDMMNRFLLRKLPEDNE